LRLSSTRNWRTPLVIIVCGCLIALLGFGPRSTLGFFVQPMSREFTWGRDVFGLALALQNLMWGLGQPVAGAIADRFGSLRVICVGALLYAGGLVIMRYAATPLSLDIGAGVLIGFGLSGCSFNLVLSAFSKLLPPERRGLALGAGTAAGSFGQFLFAPFGVAMIDNFGWQMALTVFAGLMLLIVPLSLALATPPTTSSNVPVADQQSFKTALAEAFGHRSYVLLVLGFFTCGFQLAFITVHLPAYLVDRGIPAQTGGWVIATMGLFNIIGSLGVGWLQNYMPKRFILSTIYFTRAVSIVAFISFPITTFSALMFGAISGLTWLSTVPPTSALVAMMFGTRWFATLYGFAFVSHQVGGFLGVLLGGIVFESFGSYTPIWWLSVLFGVLSALINLPIIEAPVARPVAQPA
jgi:MFS family permease